MNTQEKIANLLSVTQRMCTILERENAALAQHRPDLIAPSVEEKSKLSKAYELLTKSLADDAEGLEKLDESAREQLDSAMGNLSVLSEENARKLKIAIEASQRVMNAVAKAAKSTMPQNNAYGRDGSVGPTPSQALTSASPLSLDQVL